MKRTIGFVLAQMVMLCLFSASGLSETISIENFDRTMAFDKVPERIVSLSYSETEILVALGLADKIIGIAEAENTIEDCMPEQRETIADFRSLAPLKRAACLPWKCS